MRSGRAMMTALSVVFAAGATVGVPDAASIGGSETRTGVETDTQIIVAQASSAAKKPAKKAPRRAQQAPAQAAPAAVAPVTSVTPRGSFR